jgi:hypothetical protein
MQESTWLEIGGQRGRNAQMLILPYVVLHSTVMVIIAFAGDALADSSVQLAVAGVAIIGSIWTALNFDGEFANFAALRDDMPEGVASSNYGALFAKAPIGVFRVIGVVFTALIVILELMAIY